VHKIGEVGKLKHVSEAYTLIIIINIFVKRHRHSYSGAW